MPRVARAAPRAGASRAGQVQDRPGRLKLLLRRQRRLLRPAVWLLGIGLLGLGATVVAHAGAPGGTLAVLRERLDRAAGDAGFRVAFVDVQGRANTPEPLLRAAIGISPGDPILGFSLADARARIESLSWVEHAEVSRLLPDRIVVWLTERRPFAVWQNQGHFVLIDRSGQPVADQNLAGFDQLPLVVGPGAPAAAAAMLDTLAAHPALRARVVAAVRVGERRWNLRLKTGADVLLPEGEEPAALTRLDELQDSQALLDRALQVVDLRLPDRLVVRPLPDAHAEPAHPEPAHPAVSPAAKRPT